MEHWRALSDQWDRIASHMALFGAIAGQPMFTRLMEAAMIAVVTSSMTAYTVSVKLEERIAAMAQRQVSLETTMHEHQVEDIRNHERMSVCEARIQEVLSTIAGKLR